jgi:acyl-coenzyme A synthetase/AMP-(fatty) acid ligase
VVILPRFEPEAFMSAVQTYRVTRAEVAPPIVLALASSDLVDHYDLTSLRTVTAGAARGEPISRRRAQSGSAAASSRASG